MSTKVAVVIPVYREELSDLEKISLAQCRKILGNYPLIFVVPDGKDFSYFKAGDAVANFPAEYFRSKETYTRLLTSPFFYETFSDFEYMLIYQLDAFVFYDALKEFCSLGYDYVGAPWPRIFSKRLDGLCVRVNNGGFSLRKVAACHKLLLRQPDLLKRHRELPEDVFFSYCGARSDVDFSVAPINVAYAFSAEINPARSVKKNGGTLPFGCHNWNFDAAFYVKNFLRFGWDLRPMKNLLADGESEFILRRALTIVALLRLSRRIERRQPLLRYLPTNRFAAVVVVRDEMTVKILEQLLREENFSSEQIVVCDAASSKKIFADLPQENLPYLFIGAQENYDAHGKQIISFRREYLSRCEENFHNLGKF